jgi:hypothetical protein
MQITSICLENTRKKNTKEIEIKDNSFESRRIINCSNLSKFNEVKL